MKISTQTCELSRLFATKKHPPCSRVSAMTPSTFDVWYRAARIPLYGDDFEEL
jgi:hypothetical protein